MSDRLLCEVWLHDEGVNIIVLKDDLGHVKVNMDPPKTWLTIKATTLMYIADRAMDAFTLKEME